MKSQREIAIFNVPPAFELELMRLNEIKTRRNPKKPAQVQFALAFVMQQGELERLSEILAAGADGEPRVC